MFVYSLRFSKVKMLCCICLLALIGGLLFLPAFLEEDSAPVSLLLKSEKISDNTARVEYLRSYGWEVEEEAEAIEEIVIPKEFNDVFEKYNEIQKAQGFDLEKQKGQRVKRYTYVVTNYPDEPDYVRANLFICKDKVVAGDICSLRVKDGFLHGLKMENEQ